MKVKEDKGKRKEGITLDNAGTGRNRRRKETGKKKRGGKTKKGVQEKMGRVSCYRRERKVKIRMGSKRR